MELWQLEVGAFFVSHCFKNCEDGFTWVFTNVYNHAFGGEQDDFWLKLGDIKGL